MVYDVFIAKGCTFKYINGVTGLPITMSLVITYKGDEMNISSSLKMAIRILLYMVDQDTDRYILSADIAKDLGFPKDYLSKILGQLVKSQLLFAAKGKWGGYALAKKPEEISLLDVHEAIEGKIQVNECNKSKLACDMYIDYCPITDAYDRVFEQIRSQLHTAKIQHLIDETNVRRQQAV
jgi:Rrf2 family transcriptional regulator, iron-sulfur cluster assembly transcription factor